MKYLGKALRREKRDARKQRRYLKAKAASVAPMQIKRTLGNVAEKKYFDSSSSTQQSYTGTVIALSIPTVGTGDLNRLGDMIQQYSLDFRCNIFHGDVNNAVRMLVIRWLVDGDPTWSDVMVSDTSVYAPISQFNKDKRQLFQVLYDTGVRVLNSGYSGIHINKYIPLKLYKQRFLAGATTNIKGGLYLLQVSDSSAVNHPSMTWTTRFKFVDI